MLQCVPVSNETKLKLTVKNLCDAVQHISSSFLAYFFCIEQGVDVCWGFFVDGYALFFVVLYFKRSEAQRKNWLNKNQNLRSCLKIA